MKISPSLRAIVLTSPLLPVLVFPYRLLLVLRHLSRQFRSALTWLVRSREFTNFTYDLSAGNKEYLAWFIAGICNRPVREISGYFSELEGNDFLNQHISRQLRASRRGKEIDQQAHFGRRLGWYALIRVCKPELVVETGTEKGLGSLVIAEALSRNGSGRLITIDMEPSSGLLLGDAYQGVIEHKIGDSLEVITQLRQVDLFIHDSDHSATHEANEFEIVEDRLSKVGVVISDNAHATTALAEWSLKTNRNFSFFAERPLNHWYPGAGIGVSTSSRPNSFDVG